ncbi:MULTISPECIES: hypothetical protein [unclassified Coleofasciculus]|nr:MULTISPECIES: hypothetical protein [unclassified Coleofasciculus]MBE9124720.1 hypothetical protein [Coleofasciculus sp. LEGE 07081]MBE9151845.1 hypothetical protein [Coleofasciculus sp. LEGE 07092]
MVNWDTDELRVAFEKVGLGVEVDEERSHWSPNLNAVVRLNKKFSLKITN